MNRIPVRCPLTFALSKFDGKWKPLILWGLGESVMRFSELQRVLPGVNAKMLIKQLRELEEDGITCEPCTPRCRRE